MRCLSTLLVASLFACAGNNQRIRIAEHLRAEPGSPAAAPYLVKLTDGTRQWEIAVPEVDGGYELRIPIGDGTPLLPDAAAMNAGAQSPTPDASGGGVAATGQAERPADYLRAVALVDALYGRRSYDLALRQLRALLAAHPTDTRLLAMAGTLHLKLGDSRAAQAAWERVLELEPGNQTVLSALEELP